MSKPIQPKRSMAQNTSNRYLKTNSQSRSLRLLNTFIIDTTRRETTTSIITHTSAPKKGVSKKFGFI